VPFALSVGTKTASVHAETLAAGWKNQVNVLGLACVPLGSWVQTALLSQPLLAQPPVAEVQPGPRAASRMVKPSA
jgi:hypothetical protein